jgi:imidazolonepropionase
MQPVDFLIEHADHVATCAGTAPKRGLDQQDIAPLADASIAAYEGRIVYLGAADALPPDIRVQPDATRIDARGCTVVPGFVDAHTHVVFAGDRREELRRRLAGASYEDIAARGGGILATMAATRAASEDELVQLTRPRLDAMLACGTTTCEAKSGYGLTTESELRQLRALRTLDHSHAIDIVPTFLGAHEIPPEYRHDRDSYVRLVIEEMVPAVSSEGLAEFCDVFCERGVFTPEESRAILAAGARAGMRSRIHAHEFARSGGCDVAGEVRAISADHLVHASDDDITAIAGRVTCATLLPTASFYLKLGRYAPAREMIERGVAVALGTDVNPGGGLSPSMPFAMTLACLCMHMTMEEALVAATLNAAASLGHAHTVGSLEGGKLMDAVVIGGSLVDLLRVGSSAIKIVVKRSAVVFPS